MGILAVAEAPDAPALARMRAVAPVSRGTSSWRGRSESGALPAMTEKTREVSDGERLEVGGRTNVESCTPSPLTYQ